MEYTNFWRFIPVGLNNNAMEDKYFNFAKKVLKDQRLYRVVLKIMMFQILTLIHK